MDDRAFKERAKRLVEVNKVVSKLDPAIRSQAFEFLQGYITDVAGAADSGGTTKPKRNPGGGSQGGASQEEFFAKFEHDRPSECVLLITADYYRQYGKHPFTAEYLRDTAHDAGFTVPERIPDFLRQCKKNKKAIFQSAGRGKYKPTVSGETYFKTTYEVKKGTGTPPDPEA